MFLSFIVPVYNAEAYIEECLQSLLDQDLPKEDYEIICVNDGSRDGSLAVLQKFAREYPNIIVIDKENGGVATARNAGLAAAGGEYVWFVDSDDFIRKNILGRLYTASGSGDYDRLIIGCYFFEDRLTDEEQALSREGKLPLNGPWYDSIVVRSIFRRSYLKKHDLTFRYPEITHGEDGMFMYEAVIPGLESFLINEAIYFYRCHSGSAETAVSVENRKKKLRSYVRICQILLDYYRNKGQKNQITANKLMSFLWMAIYEITKLPDTEAQTALAELRQAGLYPFRRLPECSLEKSYLIGRSDLLGKAVDSVLQNLHRPWGYRTMRLIQKLK